MQDRSPLELKHPFPDLPSGRGPIPGSRPRGFYAAKFKAQAEARAAAAITAAANATPSSTAPAAARPSSSSSSRPGSGARLPRSRAASSAASRASSGAGAGAGAGRGGGGGGADEEHDAMVIPETMTGGMRELLELHNLDELAILCDDVGVGVEDKMTKEQRINILFDEVLTSNPQYHFLLSRIWEGILIEYWRSLGKNIKSYKWDIRQIVMGWWNRSRVIEVKPQDFKNVYVGISTTEPTEVMVDRRGGTEQPEKVREALKELALLETDLKECERRLRFARNFDAIMDYFAAVADLRKYEAELRNRLIVDLQLTQTTIYQHQAAKETAENVALDARTQRYEMQTKWESMQYTYDQQTRRADKAEARAEKLDKELFSMTEQRDRERAAKIKLQEELRQLRESSAADLEEARSKLKNQTVVTGRLQKKYDEVQRQLVALQRDHKRAVKELRLKTGEAEHLLEAGTRQEAIGDWYAGVFMGDGAVDTAVSSAFDATAAVVAKAYAALSAAAPSKGKQSRPSSRGSSRRSARS